MILLLFTTDLHVVDFSNPYSTLALTLVPESKPDDSMYIIRNIHTPTPVKQNYSNQQA